MHAKFQLIICIRSRVLRRAQNLVSYIYNTCIHTFFKNSFFWLKNFENIEVHQNLSFQNQDHLQSFLHEKAKLYYIYICVTLWKSLCRSERKSKNIDSSEVLSESSLTHCVKRKWKPNRGALLKSCAGSRNLRGIKRYIWNFPRKLHITSPRD